MALQELKREMADEFKLREKENTKLRDQLSDAQQKLLEVQKQSEIKVEMVTKL